MEVKISVKKIVLAAAACSLSGSCGRIGAGRSRVRVAPPAPIVEVHDHPPHPGWVWVDGYHRWDGHRYVWVHGYWAHPPHPGAVWVAHHWEQRSGGWVLVEGHWR